MTLAFIHMPDAVLGARGTKTDTVRSLPFQGNFNIYPQ